MRFSFRAPFEVARSGDDNSVHGLHRAIAIPFCHQRERGWSTTFVLMSFLHRRAHGARRDSLVFSACSAVSAVEKRSKLASTRLGETTRARSAAQHGALDGGEEQSLKKELAETTVTSARAWIEKAGI